MSRFSKNTARWMGCSLFLVAGGVGYLSYKDNQTVVAQKDELARYAPIDHPPLSLGTSIDYATELSSVITPTRFDDPIVSLTPQRPPRWVRENAFEEIDRLAKTQIESNVPAQYPYDAATPVAIPRRGDAVRRDLAPASLANDSMPTANVETAGQRPSGGELTSLAPLPLQVRPYQPTGVFATEIPMVSLRDPVTAIAGSSAVANDNSRNGQQNIANQPTSWPDRGMVMLRNLQKGLFPATVSTTPAAPPPPSGTASNEVGATHLVGRIQTPSPSGPRPLRALAPSTAPRTLAAYDESRYIMQPGQ